MTILKMTPDQIEARMDVLCALLKDAIDGGASMSYLPPLSDETARDHWQGVATSIASGDSVLLVVMMDGQWVGSVQLGLAWQPNGQHRAEVQKLIVHSAYRRRGLATQLMKAIEQLAIEHGRRLLVLDTEQGSGAETFYRELGYTEAGVIPNFAVDATGQAQATVLFYKQLADR